jgi:hypothetical protein
VVGKYGNANVDYVKDWLDVSTNGTYNGEWFSANASCTLPTAIDLEILHSTVGFDENQHSYIIGIRK